MYITNEPRLATHIENLIRLYTLTKTPYNEDSENHQKGGGNMGDDNMTRLELLTLLLSIKALLESDNKDKALELINEVISEAKRKDN